MSVESEAISQLQLLDHRKRGIRTLRFHHLHEKGPGLHQAGLPLTVGQELEAQERLEQRLAAFVKQAESTKLATRQPGCKTVNVLGAWAFKTTRLAASEVASQR